MIRVTSKNILVASTATLLLSLSIFGAVAYITYRSHTELAAAAETAAATVAADSQALDLRHLLASTARERAAIDSYLVGNDTSASYTFISSIEALGAKAGVDESVDTVALGSGTKDGRFETIDVTISARGSLARVYWFLSLLETLPYHTQVTGLSLGRLPADPDAKKGSLSEWRLVVKTSTLKIK